MAASDKKTPKGSERIPGYGQPPEEGERSGRPSIPDQGNRWGAQTEGKPLEAPDGSQGQHVPQKPDISDQPLRTPKQTP